MIRDAEPSDWLSISEISKIAGYDDYINAIGPSYLSSGRVIVYTMDERIVGFLKVEALPDSSAWLSGLRVHPGYRRMSVATQLTESALDSSKESGIKRVRLLVQHNNLRSSSLVKKMGFSKTADFCFFRGIPEAVSDVPSLLPGLVPNYINLGWVFCEPLQNVLEECTFFSTAGNGIVSRFGNNAWQIIRPSDSMVFKGDEFSCIEIHGELPDYLLKHVSPEFDYGSIYELSF